MHKYSKKTQKRQSDLLFKGLGHYRGGGLSKTRPTDQSGGTKYRKPPKVFGSFRQKTTLSLNPNHLACLTPEAQVDRCFVAP